MRREPAPAFRLLPIPRVDSGSPPGCSYRRGRGGRDATSDFNLYLEYNYSAQELFADCFTAGGPGVAVGNAPNATWTAFALVCSANVVTMYINGVANGLPINIATARASHPVTAGTLLIGEPGAGLTFGGYLSDIRVSSFARYSGTYTPAGPFDTAACAPPCDSDYSDVGVWLKMDGANASATFVDSGPNALTVTNNNSATQTNATAPVFEPTSGVFGITGITHRYLTVPFVSSGPLDLSTGDFTIEGWVYPNSGQISGEGSFVWSDDNSISLIWNEASAEFVFQFWGGGISSAAHAVPVSSWTAFAVVLSGSTLKLFVNGVLVNSTPVSGRAAMTASTWQFGNVFSSIPFSGYLSNIRITKGVARYSADYAPVPFGGTCAVTVPNVTGQALATAESNIVAAGLVVGTVSQTSDPVINNGFVILTSPSAGSGVMAGSSVDITESNSETVPNVNGELLATGESDLTGAGFSVGTVTTTTDPVINDGYIISTSPAGGTRATAGSAVDISESISATVPNVVNTVLATGESAITGAGLAVGSVTTASSLTVPGGYIISTSPVGGVRTTAGASVDILESSGPGTGTVPDVLNLSQALATAAIIAAGFTVGSVTTQPDAIIIPGNVDEQNPAGGDTAYLLSPVNIIVSSGLPTLRVPDLFGLTQAEATVLLASLGLVVGAIGTAPSNFIPPGTVMTQNPSAGTPVGAGTIVSFVLSTGVPAVGVIFDFEATVISQYANSPTILQLVNNLNQYIDQSANFANFFNYVWNVDTAVGFGLDVWGKIVGVSRLLQIPNTTDYVGFFQNGEITQDWQPMGSDQPPQPAVGGAMYTGHNATQTYLLDDNAYRQLILAKAFANICTTTAPAINQILQNLYGPGTAFVLNEGPMAISYNLTFTPTAIQLAILQQSGVIPTPPGVSVVINTNV